MWGILGTLWGQVSYLKMTRTIGAKDKRKREFYAGKPIKKRGKHNPSFVPYNSVRHRGDPLKVQIVQRRPMSIDGFKSWSKKIRPKVNRTVFIGFPSIRVPPEDLSTKEGLGNVVIDDRQSEGIFDVRFPSASKNKGHISYRTKAIVRVDETEEGLRAKVLECWKIKRYFFWKGD